MFTVSSVTLLSTAASYPMHRNQLATTAFVFLINTFFVSLLLPVTPLSHSSLSPCPWAVSFRPDIPGSKHYRSCLPLRPVVISNQGAPLPWQLSLLSLSSLNLLQPSLVFLTPLFKNSTILSTSHAFQSQSLSLSWPFPFNTATTKLPSLS